MKTGQSPPSLTSRLKSSAPRQSLSNFRRKLLKQIDQSEAALRSAKTRPPQATAEPPASLHQKNSIELLNKLIQQLEQQSEKSDTPGGSPEKSFSPANPDASSKPESGKSQGQSSEKESSRPQKETTTKDRAAKNDASPQGSSQSKVTTRTQMKRKLATANANDWPRKLPARRQLEVDVWGHLPDTVRGELLNSFDERILPRMSGWSRNTTRLWRKLSGIRGAKGSSSSSAAAAGRKSPWARIELLAHSRHARDTGPWAVLFHPPVGDPADRQSHAVFPGPTCRDQYGSTSRQSCAPCCKEIRWP